MKSKILFLLHVPPPVHGVVMMGQYISESKGINNKYDCSYIRLGTTANFKERKKTTVKKIGRFFQLVFKFTWHLLKNRPDLCYITLNTTGQGFYKDGLLAIIAKTLGVPVVYHLHNKGVSTRHDRSMDDRLYRLVFKKSNVILLSWLLFSDIEKYVSREQVLICPNGIPDVEKNAIPPSENSVIEILFFSNLLETKGVLLLEACILLQKWGVKFKCVFAGGEGDIMAADFNKFVRSNGLQDCATYIGRKYNEKKLSVFNSADIFVFPTYKEAFGLVNLEAMQHSLPVVSTFEGGVPDVVEDGKTGILVPPKNVHELAMALKKLLDEPRLRKSMGVQGRERYEKEFTLERFERNLVKVLDRILDR